MSAVEHMSAGVNFALTDDQLMLQKLAREFTAKEIIPVAEEHDRHAKFPKEIFHKARELGIANMNIPAEYGGVGASVFEEVLVSEEMAYGCTGISTSVGTNGLASLPILLAGNEQQKQYWLGERLVDKGEFCSYGVTEAAAGSNVIGIETRAEKKGAGWVINGSKTFITNASHANFFTVFAKTDPNAGHRGMTCFIVDRNMPGVKVGRKFDKLGQRASDTAEIVFENVEVPGENLVGGEGKGFYLAMKVFDYSRPGVAAAAVGLQRRCLDESVKYASERIAFGVPIYQHQPSGIRSRIWRSTTTPRACWCGSRHGRPTRGSKIRLFRRMLKPSRPIWRPRLPSTPCRCSAATDSWKNTRSPSCCAMSRSSRSTKARARFSVTSLSGSCSKARNKVKIWPTCRPARRIPRRAGFFLSC